MAIKTVESPVVNGAKQANGANFLCVYVDGKDGSVVHVESSFATAAVDDLDHMKRYRAAYSPSDKELVDLNAVVSAIWKKTVTSATKDKVTF